MKNEDLKELKKIINESVSAHQRANWDKKAAREIIVDVMIKKFKKYLERK